MQLAAPSSSCFDVSISLHMCTLGRGAVLKISEPAVKQPYEHCTLSACATGVEGRLNPHAAKR